MAEGQWSPIESDPAVFTELIREFGARGVEVVELWSLTPDAFERLGEVHGLIFLFKWGCERPGSPVGRTVPDEPGVFFARQVTENACATQAVVNLLLNCRHSDLELGTPLTELRDFCQSFEPHMKGLALTNSAAIRTAHNSFARQTPFECDPRSNSPKEDDAAYHFVTYVPIDGKLYELDGLKEGPVDLGAPPTGSTWLEQFASVVQKRIDRYNEGEIRFNLMALVSDRKMLYERQMAAVRRDVDASQLTDEQKEELALLEDLVAAEEDKRRRNKAEIARRRHNYLAFIVELLKILAKEGKLMPLYERAREKAAKKLDV